MTGRKFLLTEEKEKMMYFEVEMGIKIALGRTERRYLYYLV